MAKKTPNLQFITRQMMALATKTADRYPPDHRIRTLIDMVLKELGVHLRYPPVVGAR
jgi:hypothetical protein